MQIRPATPSDADAIVRLTGRLADFPVPRGRTMEEIARADHPIIHAQLAAPRADVLFLLAEDGDEPLGTVFANTRRDYFTGAEHAYVEVLAVAEAASGRGVARALLESVERWAGERRYGRIELSVFAANTRARGLYEHLGYTAEIIRYVKPLADPLVQPAPAVSSGSGSPRRAR